MGGERGLLCAFFFQSASLSVKKKSLFRLACFWKSLPPFFQKKLRLVLRGKSPAFYLKGQYRYKIPFVRLIFGGWGLGSNLVAPPPIQNLRPGPGSELPYIMRSEPKSFSVPVP